MPDPGKSGAEAALRAALEDIFRGGGMAIFQDFTSAAYVDLLHVMPHFSDLPKPNGYEVLGCEVVDEDYKFEVRLLTTTKNVHIFMVMRGGGEQPWKVAAIKVPGIRD